MRKLLYLLLLLGFFACQHDSSNYRSEGVITGVDYRYCACCGGWFFEIEGGKYRAYLSESDVQRLNLAENVYPVAVRLDWEKQMNFCLGDEIVVTRIERR